jgi:hypothetical protein
VTGFIAALLLLAVLGELVFEGVRSSRFARRAEISIDSAATEQQLVDAQNWFNEYSATFNGFAFAPNADEAQEYIAKLDSQLGILRDRMQYEQLLARRDIDACEAYTQSAPLKTMLPEVSNYLKYLHNLREQKEIGVSIQMTWDDKCEPGADHSLKLTINADEIAVVTEEPASDVGSHHPFESEPGTTRTVGTCRFVLTDSLTVLVRLARVKKGFERVTFWNETAFVGNADNVTFSDLARGLDIKLHPEKKVGDLVNQIRFAIKDPPPPDLPSVHRDR